MLHRFLSLLFLLVLLSPAALAEPSFLEEVSSILRTPGAASDVLPPETVQRLNEAAECYAGEAQAIGPSESPYTYDFTLGMLETVYGVYQGWPITIKHDFDRLMVDLGQLSACLNLLPGPDEIPQEEAEERAFAEIEKRFGVAAGAEHAQVNAFYRRMHQEEAPAWAFAVDTEDRAFDVTVQGGRVTLCREIQAPAALQLEYEALCAARGAFFQWTIEQKAEYAGKLCPDEAWDFPGSVELRAIAEMGFCLPNVSSISQADAKARAVQAVSQAYHLPEGWADGVPCFFSFFAGGQAQYTWRVIFWQQEGFRGLVELDAASGEILRVREDGGTLETSIPYPERL